MSNTSEVPVLVAEAVKLHREEECEETGPFALVRFALVAEVLTGDGSSVAYTVTPEETDFWHLEGFAALLKRHADRLAE